MAQRFTQCSLVFALLPGVALVFGGACGTSSGTVPPGPPCGSGSAQILVYDGLIQDGCGCAEGLGTQAVPPATLTCTVFVGSTVFFQVVGGSLPHQIAPANGASFEPGPIFDPSTDAPVRAFALLVSAPGSIAFLDTFDPLITGTIIAQ